MKIHVKNEYSRLRRVVLGIADHCGGPPHVDEAYDPKTKEFLTKGIYPHEEDMVEEMDAFCRVLEKYDVEVLRPDNTPHLNQIFTRDICFVLDDKLVIPDIIRERLKEQAGIQYIIDQIDEKNILRAPKGVRIEGGDVIAHNEYILVGYSEEDDFYNFKTARTNKEGLEFLQKSFPQKKVLGFQLKKSDYEARENALHLDCCYQPLGLGHLLIFEDGFKYQEDLERITSYFGPEMIIKVSRQEMFNMGCNVFSIDKNIVVSERGLVRINDKLRQAGYIVEEIPYYQISKLEGLLRCSTLPLLREDA